MQNSSLSHPQQPENTSQLNISNTSNSITHQNSRAKKMSIQQIQKKSDSNNRSQSIQNILSSSIARAKQKIQMMQQKKNVKDYYSNSSRSVEKRESNVIIVTKQSTVVNSNNINGPNVPLQQPSIKNQQSSYTTNSSNKKPIPITTQQIETTRSRQPSNKLDTNIAVVNVVKSLQIKIAELQRLNQSIQREKLIMTKQLNNVTQQKRLLLQNMQQVKKKNVHLQHTIIKSLKQQLKQSQSKYQQLQTQNIQLKNNMKQLQLKLKQQHMSHLSIQKSNEKKMKQKKDEQKTQLQKQQMIYLSKLKQTQLHDKNLNMKQKQLLQKQKKLQLKWTQIFQKQTQISKRQKIIEDKQQKNYQQLIRHNQTMTLANQVRKELQQKNSQLKKMLEQQKKMNEQNKTKLTNLMNINNTTTTNNNNKSSHIDYLQQQQNINTNEQLYTTKINQLQYQLQQLKDTYKHNSKSKLSLINKNDKIQSLKQQIININEQYDELIVRYKKLEDKLQKEQKQAKNYRSKFWKLKQIITEISQKVSKMPTAIHSQLKLRNYLLLSNNVVIVKANKLQSYQIQKSSLSHIYGTPTSKKSRSNSTQKSITKLSNKDRSKSKDKSTTSKTKTMNLPQLLDSSRKSNHSIKSKRSQKSQRSFSSKKKQVIISTANKQMTTQTDKKIYQLQRQIQQLKTTYKKLVEIMNERNDEETRNQLNTLVFQLQQRSEELTRLKKEKKQKRL